MTAFSRRTSFFASIVLLTLALSGCTEEWWTRGQPPAMSTVVRRAEDRLNESLAANTAARPDFAPLAKDLQAALKGGMGALQNGMPGAQLRASLVDCRNSFLKLEQSLSPGSRAAYGELSGQMRQFAQAADEGKAIEFPSFELFSARTMFFLASELSVPAPVSS